MKSKRITALVLSLMLVLSMSVTAFADNSKTATVPVTLTVSNQYRAINVTVPAALPVEVRNGAVVTADNISIINNSGTAVQVTGVTVNDGAYKVGSYDSFTGSKTIALKINGCATTGSGRLAINDTAFPVIAAGGNQALSYYAKVSADAPNESNVQAASVIFTISIIE